MLSASSSKIFLSFPSYFPVAYLLYETCIMEDKRTVSCFELAILQTSTNVLTTMAVALTTVQTVLAVISVPVHRAIR